MPEIYTWRDFQEIANLRDVDNILDFTSYAIQSQYSASEKILALAAAMQKSINPQADVELLYDKVFNIYTAQGAALDNWGVIIQIPRTIPGIQSSRASGIQSGANKSLSGTPESITLNDEYYRLLLLYKAMANISASTASSQNSLLAMLVNTGIAGLPRVAYVLEVGVMLIRWVFEDFLNDTQLAVFYAAGTLTRGAGVGWELYAIEPSSVFGFNGSLLQPFNQGAFAPDNILISSRS